MHKLEFEEPRRIVDEDRYQLWFGLRAFSMLLLCLSSWLALLLWVIRDPFHPISNRALVGLGGGLMVISLVFAWIWYGCTKEQIEEASGVNDGRILLYTEVTWQSETRSCYQLVLKGSAVTFPIYVLIWLIKQIGKIRLTAISDGPRV